MEIILRCSGISGEIFVANRDWLGATLKKTINKDVAVICEGALIAPR